MADIIKTHDDDVIFSYESLQEFIRLIQRQGINNLTIYSVNELLVGETGQEKWRSIKTRMPPPTYKQAPTEFSEEELKGKRNYFVFVRYSFPWEEGGTTKNNIYTSNNEKNGRHVFIQTVNDIKFYKSTSDTQSSVFNRDTANTATIITEDMILSGNNNYYNKNGTFVVTIDNTQYVIKIRGFNDDGKYTGGFLPGQGTGKFLRGDGSWTNTLYNSFNPGTNDSYNLGSSTLKWKNLYLSNTLNVDGESKLSNTIPRTTGTYDLGSSNNYWKDFYITGNILPETIKGNNNNQVSDSSLGANGQRWNKLWAKDGDFSGSVNIGGNLSIGSGANPKTLTINGRTLQISHIPSSTSTSAKFWRGDGTWNNYLDGSFALTANKNAYLYIGAYGGNYGSSGYAGLWYCANSYNGYQATTLYCDKKFSAPKVYNAVFNDYAECRKTIDLEPGRAVQDNDDGSLSCASQRLIPGCHIISDTYGNLMGETEDCKTPIAVAGRVLVYPYQNRENYHAGMSVCAAPNGTVDIMTREEIINYPDCIIGTVSEIPNYETWGTDNVNVNGRIWIYVK